MRGLLLLCCLVALASKSLLYSFIHKKIYEYKYEGTVNFGLGAPNLTESGVRIQCTVKITGLSTQAFTLQVTNLSFEEFNGIQGKDGYKASSKLTKRIAAQLSKPFLFDHSNGHVGDIHASPEVSETIVNMVRGMLDLLHATVKTTQLVYELEEIGIHGICQTNYAIEGIPEGEDVTVTQVVDVSNCREKAEMYKGMAAAMPDKSSRQRGQSVISTVRYVYNIKPTPDGGLITRAEGLEQQFFSPFNVKRGSFRMQAKKEISLVTVTDLHSPVTFETVTNKGNIVYKFVSSEAYPPIIMQNLQDPTVTAIELIKRLAQANNYRVDNATTEDAMKLYQLLRITPYEGFEIMWKQFQTNDVQRRWFLDMIAEVNDEKILKFLEARFVAGHLTANEAVQALVIAINHLQATPELVEKAKKFFDMPFTRSNVYVWQTVVLSYGSLVYKHCAYYTPCPVIAVQPLLDMAMEALRKNNETDMVLSLKALGNAGHPSSIKTIMRFLPGIAASPVSLPARVQSAAVQAMRLIAARDPLSVQDIAMSLFLQKNLDSELRMLALMILFDAQPSMGVVSTVTVHLQEETDLHVGSFAYSYLKSLASSRTPENTFLSTASTLAVRILAPKFGRLDYHHSKASRHDWFDDNFLLGTAIEGFLLKNATSIFPTEMVAKSKLYAIGRIMQLTEMGIRADGLKELLNTSIPVFKEQFNFSDFQAIFNKVQNYWDALPNEKPVLSAYSRVSGQEWFFTDITKEFIRDMITAISSTERKDIYMWRAIENLQKGFSWRWTKPFLNFEARYFQATIMGFPLEISKYYHAVTGISIDAKLSVSPPMNGQLSQLLSSKVSLDSSGFMGFTKDLWIFYGINTELFQSGSEFKTKMPLSLPWDFSAKINIGQRKFEIDFPACKKEIEFFSVRYVIDGLISSPDIKAMSWIVNQISFSSHLNLWHPQTKMCAKSNMYGLDLCVEADVRRQYYHRDYPLSYFLGYTYMALKLSPAQGVTAVDKIHFEASAGSSQQTMATQQLLNILRKLSKKAFLRVQQDSQSSSAEEYQTAHPDIEMEALNSTAEALLNIKAFALSANQNQQGYDVSLYYRPEGNISNDQLIVSQIAKDTNWKMCADAVLDAEATVKAHIRWGAECQSFEMSVSATASSPWDVRPAINATVHWTKIPDDLTAVGSRVEKYIPGMAFLLGFYQQQEKNPLQEVSVSIAAPSADSIDVKIKVPEYTVYREAFPFPVQPANFLEFYSMRNETIQGFGQA
uniref:Vitellogenin 3, phosvitinless n=1 Tax=Salarias fasciatus TaxID=181472 RepID=A0A672HI71_SALFA